MTLQTHTCRFPARRSTHFSLMLPKASLLLSVRNGSPYLRETISGWLGQTHPHFELLVWDNGSTDETRAVLDEFRDPRLRLVYSGEDCGLQGGWFGLLEHASGEYCLSPDADDIPEPTLLASLLKSFADPGSPAVAHAGYSLIDSAGVKLPMGSELRIELPGDLPSSHMLRILVQHNPIKKSAALLQTAQARKAAALASHRLLSAVDWYFWFLVLGQGGGIRYNQDTLLRYRVHATSLSRGPEWRGRRSVEDLLAPWAGLEDAARESVEARQIRKDLWGMLEPVLLSRMLRASVRFGFFHPDFPRCAGALLSRTFIKPLAALRAQARLRGEIPFPCSGFLAADNPVFRSNPGACQADASNLSQGGSPRLI